MMGDVLRDQWGLVLLAVLLIVGYAGLELRDRWHAKRREEVKQHITEWIIATHLDDCRRGIHRTTVDADWKDVYGETWSPRHLIERCIDCGLTIPLGTVEPTGSNFAKKPHG